MDDHRHRRWDPEALDLLGPAFIEFTDDGGQFGFVAVRGHVDCRSTTREDRPAVEFSWEGDDDGGDRSGRGWAALTNDNALIGHVFIHRGDDFTFTAEPSPT